MNGPLCQTVLRSVPSMYNANSKEKRTTPTSIQGMLSRRERLLSSTSRKIPFGHIPPSHDNGELREARKNSGQLSPVTCHLAGLCFHACQQADVWHLAEGRPDEHARSTSDMLDKWHIKFQIKHGRSIESRWAWHQVPLLACTWNSLLVLRVSMPETWQPK